MSELQKRSFGSGVPVVTAWEEARAAWQLWRAAQKPTLRFGCPLCRTWSTVDATHLGHEHDCPECRGRLRLNAFTTKGDWRQVAEGWR